MTMTKTDLSQQYDSYLDCIAEIPNSRYSLKYAHYEGVLHGLGIALNYDYEKVEKDIAKAYGNRAMPGQLRLVM